MLATVDDASPFMEGCPHALPENGRMGGVAAYAGIFLTGTQGGLHSTSYGTDVAHLLELPFIEMFDLFAEFGQVPPTSWREDGELSAAARDLAQRLPPYYIDGSEPPFLLIGEDAVGPEETEAFAASLQSVGVPVEQMQLPGGTLTTIVSPASPSFVKIVEAMEGFMARLSAG